MTSPPSGADLRALLLRQTPADLQLTPTADLPHVWAALMEWLQSGNVVTLAVVADGTTSLYFSKSGAVIGGGEHHSVREASRKWLATMEKFLGAGAFVTRDKPLDVVKDAVCFVVLTHEGMRVARDTATRLEKRESPIWPLFYMGHDVIAKMREVSEKKTGG